jgi:hypothetical protein
VLSSEYFERQADVCRRLAAVSTVPQIVARLLCKADEYEAKASVPTFRHPTEMYSVPEEIDRRQQR